MGFHSAFILTDPKTGIVHRLPNFITDEGVQAFLKMVTQGVAIGEDGDWFMGLCGLPATKATTLATLPSEPTSQGGYARQLLSRDNVDWPDANVAQVNGIYRIRSVQVDFTATGADFSTSIHRAFICNDLTGTTGTLFAISSPLPEGRLITDTETYPTAYEFAFD